MKIKLNAAERLKTELHSSTQDRAGQLLTALKPVLGANFKKKATGETLEEVTWKTPHYVAIIELDKGDHLSFHFFSEDAADLDLSASVYGEGTVSSLWNTFRYELMHVPKSRMKNASVEVKELLQKLYRVRLA
jgi:hypothetical protein